MPSMTSSPISTRDAADDVGVDDDVQVDRPAVLPRQRVREPLRARRPSSVAGHPHGGDEPAAVLGGDLLVLSSATATVRWVPPTACSASRTVAAGGLAVEQVREQPAACRRRGGPGRTARPAARGSPTTSRSKANSSSLELVGLARLLGAEHDRDHAEVLERVGAGRGRRPSGGPTAAATSSAERRRRACRRTSRAPGRPWPRRRRTGRSATRRRPGSRRSSSATANRSSPIRRASRRRRPPRRGLVRPRGATRRRRPASARSVPVRPRRPTAGSRGRRGSARRRGSGAPRRRATPRRCGRRAPVASEPTSARSEVTACWRSASIWVLRVLDDPRRPRPAPARASPRRSRHPAHAPPHGSAPPRAGRRRAAARARPAWRRPRPAWSRPP